VIKWERYNEYSREFPPRINVPQKVESWCVFVVVVVVVVVFLVFLLLEFSLPLFSETTEKCLLLSFTLTVAEVQPIKAESKTPGKNTAKDNSTTTKHLEKKDWAKHSWFKAWLWPPKLNGFWMLIRMKLSNSQSWRKKHHGSMLMLSLYTHRHTHKHTRIWRKH